MNSSLEIARIVGMVALLAESASSKTGRAVGAEQTLSIRVYDYAQVPAPVLHSAMMETGRLFLAAGIRISWEHLLAESPEDRGTDMTAAVFQRLDGRPYLVIRLMDRVPVTIVPGALGYSLPFAHRGAHVAIFYDRVEALAQGVNVAGYVILGHTIAHELGHVLLGSTEHTSGGLMQAGWTPATWRLAAAGLVTFDRAEIRRIRAGVSKLQVPKRVPPHQPMLASSAVSKSP